NDASLDQLEHAVGDDIGMDAKIAAMLEMFQRLVGDTAEVDLKRGPVLNNFSDVAPDLLRNIVDGGMAVFRDFAFDRHQAGGALDRDQRIPWVRGIRGLTS